MLRTAMAMTMVTAALAGCGSSAREEPRRAVVRTPTPAVTRTVPTPAVTRTVPALGAVHPRVVASPQQRCRAEFPGRTVLGWRAATAAGLRAYQYGGPVAHRPLRTAFPGRAGSVAGTWCLVRAGRETAALWGVVAGSAPRHAISVTGPGSGRVVGLLRTVPEVP